MRKIPAPSVEYNLAVGAMRCIGMCQQERYAGMKMGIDVAWVTEDHHARQQVFDPRQCLSFLAASHWPGRRDTMCLQYIDPFGDTIFNQRQIPQLLKELSEETTTQRDGEIRAHLEKVIRLVERAVNEVHTYIKFVGD